MRRYSCDKIRIRLSQALQLMLMLAIEPKTGGKSAKFFESNSHIRRYRGFSAENAIQSLASNLEIRGCLTDGNLQCWKHTIPQQLPGVSRDVRRLMKIHEIPWSMGRQLVTLDATNGSSIVYRHPCA